METEKVLVAMSGGVDSSVAAKLLTDAGFSCIGCTMKLYDNEDAGIPKANTCCSLDDVEDARSVAYRLGMPYYVFNLKDKFAECVIDRFVDAYEHGITPNPCIDCNRYLKFDKLFERADIMGCRYIATGHYARIEREGEKYVLKKALDETKDQSYVLYDLTQETLARVKFPLGSLRKTEAREIAAEAGLINARKHDSQDICFVPDGDYAKVIENRTGKTPDPRPERQCRRHPSRHYPLYRRSAPGPADAVGRQNLCREDPAGAERRRRRPERGAVYKRMPRARYALDLRRSARASVPVQRKNALPPAGAALHGLSGRGGRRPPRLRRAAARHHARPVRRAL